MQVIKRTDTFVVGEGFEILPKSIPIPSGSVIPAGSSTNNAAVRFDGTTGDVIQNSAVIIDDLGNIRVNLAGAPVYSDPTYGISVQNTGSQYSWLEFINNGGTGKGAFFGMDTDEFQIYNWQGGGIGFFANTSASDGWLRLYLSNDGNVGLTGTGQWAWGNGWGGGKGVVVIGNAVTVPTSNVTDGIILYSQAGVLKVRGTTGGNLIIATTTATETLSNKRITPRVVANSTTPITPNADTADLHTAMSLSAATTFNAPSGTPVEGQKLIIRVRDNGTARALTWNAIYRAVGVTLPATTVINKAVYLTMYYNTTSTKWDVIDVKQE